MGGGGGTPWWKPTSGDGSRSTAEITQSLFPSAPSAAASAAGYWWSLVVAASTGRCTGPRRRLHSPPSAPERSRLRFFSARTVSTSGTRMEKSHRHGDTGSSVPGAHDGHSTQSDLDDLNHPTDLDAHRECMTISGDLLNKSGEHVSVRWEPGMLDGGGRGRLIGVPVDTHSKEKSFGFPAFTMVVICICMWMHVCIRDIHRTSVMLHHISTDVRPDSVLNTKHTVRRLP